MLMFAPFTWSAVVALMFATVNVPVEPLSTKVKRVFGVPLESLMDRVPAAFPVPNVIIGVVLDNVNGLPFERVTAPDALIVVAPAIAPALEMPPVLLSRPPVIDAPPAETVNAPAEVIVPVPVVAMFPEVEIVPFSLIVNLLTPPDWIAREVFVAALVSLMMKAFAVPALVKVNDVAVPESLD